MVPAKFFVISPNKPFFAEVDKQNTSKLPRLEGKECLGFGLSLNPVHFDRSTDRILRKFLTHRLFALCVLCGKKPIRLTARVTGEFKKKATEDTEVKEKFV